MRFSHSKSLPFQGRSWRKSPREGTMIPAATLHERPATQVRDPRSRQAEGVAHLPLLRPFSRTLFTYARRDESRKNKRRIPINNRNARYAKAPIPLHYGNPTSSLLHGMSGQALVAKRLHGVKNIHLDSQSCILPDSPATNNKTPPLPPTPTKPPFQSPNICLFIVEAR